MASRRYPAAIAGCFVFGAVATGGSVRSAAAPIVVTKPVVVASRDGRCLFERPMVVRVRARPAAAERIARKLETALTASDAASERFAGPAAQIATCRRVLRENASDRVRVSYSQRRLMDVSFDRDGVLGVLIERVDFFGPSAHPDVSSSAYAFDLATGRSYVASELFQPGSSAILRRLILADLHRQSLLRPAEPDLAAWYRSETIRVSPNDVLIVDGGIDVLNLFTSFAAVEISAHVSAEALRAAGIIAPTSPLRVFLPRASKLHAEGPWRHNIPSASRPDAFECRNRRLRAGTSARTDTVAR